MHQEYPWGEAMDQELRQIEQLERQQIGGWIRAQRSRGRGDDVLHLLLALASARDVDHHGPYIGHGTFNGGPMLRAASVLPEELRRLALLQTAAYVVDLLHDPNYGPYLLMSMEPLTDNYQPEERLLQAIESGDEPLRAEHRLVGLLREQGAETARTWLTYAALRQFPENEHRLLIVHRASQLLDDVEGWAWAEPILRPAVQYLATRPDVAIPKSLAGWRDVDASQGPVDQALVEAAIADLMEAPFGTESDMLHDWMSGGLSGAGLYECVALTGAELLRRSPFDAHAVTGIHCILDLLSHPHTPPPLRSLAWAQALAGQRTRRQKAQRTDWRMGAMPQAHARDETLLREVIVADRTGLDAMEAVGSALMAGADPTSVARMLMAVALTTSGPFAAIHNVKMIWGQLLETRRARAPQLAWRHLAAGARVVAETAAAEAEADAAASIIGLWRKTESP